jgi:phosphohistidine phosphatase
MDLVVVRHAIAEEHSADRPDDERALTPRGRRRMRLAVGGLRRLGLRFDLVLHSPLRRAEQTAELLDPLLRAAAPRKISEALAREPAGELLDALHGAIPSDCVAVVGHEPWTGELVAWLVLGDPTSSSGFALRKGGVAWLRGKPDPGGMRVVALLAPSVLRRLGRR